MRIIAHAAFVVVLASTVEVAFPSATADAQVRASRPSARGSRTSSRSRQRARAASSDDSPTTRGRTRRRGGATRWRQRRRTRVRMRPGLAYDDCADVRGDYCYRDSWDYYGDSIVGFGFSLGVIGGLIDTNLNGLSGSRVTGNDLTAGAVGDAGADVRMWLALGRARAGFIVQAGGVSPPLGSRALESGVFEEGSALSDGWFLGLWAMGAYQPHLSDLVQLWLGARVGYHLLELSVVANGRPYASVARTELSAGPEVGIRFSADLVGVMLQGFADLAQPGHGQLVLSFVFELPKPPSAAW